MKVVVIFMKMLLDLLHVEETMKMMSVLKLIMCNLIIFLIIHLKMMQTQARLTQNVMKMILKAKYV